MASNAPNQHVAQGQEGQRHVFISYQWDSQPMIKKLVNSLKMEGFQVWVDLDNMTGSMIDAMAKAVEEAAVVIICLSQKYKESKNCKAEADYAFRLKREIIPLRMQPDYWPDGWLGFLVGNRLMLDFTSDEKFSDSIKNLIRELGVRGKTTEYEGGTDKRVDIHEVPGPRREFFIVSEMNDKVLDIFNGDSSIGALVQVWPENSPQSKNQLWYFDNNGFIHSTLNDLVPKSRGGAQVKMAHLRGDGSQQWTVDGNKIVSKTGECLEIKGSENRDGAEVISCAFCNSSNQHWRLEYV